jgi:hypothetical protein
LAQSVTDTIGIDASVMISQSSTTVATPISSTVNKAVNLTLKVSPKEMPMKVNVLHHLIENGLKLKDRYSYLNLWNSVHMSTVKAVKNRRNESRRISLDWQARPFSANTINAANKEVISENPKFLIVAYAT